MTDDDSSNNAATTVEGSRPGRRPSRGRDQVVTAAAAGLFALGAAYIGGQISASGAIDAQTRQAEADAATAVGEKRAEVYSAFLQEYTAYYRSTQDAERRLDKGGTVDISLFIQAREKFRGALNEVYVYGSNEQWERAQATAATLPSSYGTNIQERDIRAVDEDGAELERRYAAFQLAMCKEVNFDPDRECNAPDISSARTFR